MRPRGLNCALAILLLAAAPATATALASSVSSGFKLDRWTSSDGLPQNKIESILQTSDGYIWVGTQDGLARFDGVRFTVINEVHAPNALLPGVPALAQDRVDGSLWIGTTAGLFQLRDHKLTWFNETNGLPHRKVWKLLARANGELWMDTEARLCVLKNGKFRRVGEKDGLPSDGGRCWEESPDGRIWIGNEVWRRELDDRTGRFVEIPLPGLPDSLPIRSMAFSRSGDLLLGTDHGLYRGKNGHWEHFDTKDGLGDPWIHFIFEDSTGQIWVATKESGLYCLNGDRFTRIDLGISESELSVDKMCEDREGNLWIGTREGLFRLRRQPIRTLTVADGLLDNRISTAYAGPDDTVWIGSGLGLNWVNPDGRVGSYRFPLPPPQCSVRGLCMDDSGVLWTGNFGLFQFSNNVLKTLMEHTGQSIQSIYKDRSGSIWIGIPGAVLRYHGGEQSRFTVHDGLAVSGADVFLEDQNRNLWIGSVWGLYRLRDGKIVRFSESDGLVGGDVKAILEDKDGSLWVGNDNGLFRFAQNHFFQYRAEHGLPEQTVHQILMDENGFLWLSGLHGLHRVSRDEMVAVAEGRQRSARFVSFDEADGMLSGETCGGIAPAGCRTRDGRLWFPTIKGAAVVDPGKARMNEVRPPVIIEQVKADQEIIYGDLTTTTGVQSDLNTTTENLPMSKNQSLVTSAATVSLGPRRGRVLEIRYTANSFVAPTKVHFKYRLEGHDHDWIDAGSQRFAFYTDLRPGTYRFRVKACNNHGVWNESGDSFGFAIAPRFTETSAFYLASVAAILGIGLALHRFRMQHSQRIQMLEQQLALERERARIAQDIHDDIGASLTRIHLLGQVVEGEIANQPKHPDARAHAQDIAATARQVAQRMDEIVWAVNPRHDTLGSFVDYVCHTAQEIFQTTVISSRIDVPNKVGEYRLASETRHNLYLLVKEGLHNVLKHSGATEAFLRVREAGGILEISVEDNGCGFDAEKDRSSGNGLRNMRERARKLGGECRIQSTPGRGTKLCFAIPLA